MRIQPKYWFNAKSHVWRWGIGGIFGFAIGRYGASANFAAFAFLPVGLCFGLFISLVSIKMAQGNTAAHGLH